MSDPLSISASIAGVITLVDLVYSRLVKYAKSAINATSEAKAWAAEVNSVGGILSSLSRLARALDDEPFDATLQMRQIDGCHRVLSELEKVLKKAERDLDSPNQLTVLQGKLKWPLSTGRIKELMAELSKHKANIAMALSADSMNGILRCLALSDDLKASTSEILTEVRDTRRITARIQEDSERRQVLDFFLKVNPQERYETSLRLRHPRTGLWLLRLPALQTWMDSAGSKLWLTGIPGAGKTVLAGSVIEAALAKGSENVAVAFFFCDYKDDQTHSPVNVLGALAAQLAIQKDEAFAFLTNYYRELHTARQLSRTPTIDGLQTALSSLVGQYDRTFLVVDGLDECGEHVDELVSALFSWAEDKDQVSVAMLSRNEPGIRGYLKNSYENVEIEAHTEDVAVYVAAEIEERSRTGRLRFHDPLLKEEVLGRLTEGAAGMFRWVVCQLDHLGTCLTDRECRDALGMLPPTLPETYSRILKRIPKRQVALVQMALEFIAFADPPLPIPLLEHAISVPAQGGTLGSGSIIREETISNLCSSLLRKSADGRYLELAHLSVREFLNSEDLAEFGLTDFRLSRASCARRLAVQSLRYLQLDEFNQIPEATMKGIAAIAQENDERGFYMYASIFWPAYARGAWADPLVLDLAAALLDPQKTPAFTRWAVTLSLQLLFQRDLFLKRSFPWRAGMGMRELINSHKDDSQLFVAAASKMLDRNFRPLHLSAILRLPQVCRQHLDASIDAVSIQSPLGTPLQCAVAGVLLFTEWPGMGYGWTLLNRFYKSDSMTSSKDYYLTVDCLLAAGAECSQWFELPGKAVPSMISAAMCATLDLGDYSVVSLLLARGATFTDAELRLFGAYLGVLALGDRQAPGIRSFLLSLNDLLGTRGLSVARAVWKAVQFSSHFSSSNVTSVLDTRIWLSDDAFLNSVISAISCADMRSWENLLSDPRFDPLNIRAEDGDSMLHIAAKTALFGSADGKNLLVMTDQLLQAGLSPAVTNGRGSTPLHVWNWDSKGGSSQDVRQNFVKILAQADKAIGMLDVMDQEGDNALHANLDHPRQLEAILAIANQASLDGAIRTTNTNGYTPLIEALRLGHEASARTLLQFCAGRFGLCNEKSAMSIPELAAHLAQDLLHSGVCVHAGLDEKPSPLHQLRSMESLHCVQALKALFPNSCGTSIKGRLPLDNYLHACLVDPAQGIPGYSGQATGVCEIIRELAAFDFPEKIDQNAKAASWDYFTTKIIPETRDWLGGTEGRIPWDVVRQTVRCLTDLGYLEAYEAITNRSGLARMLEAFEAKQRTQISEFWPLSGTSIALVVARTTRWPAFESSPSAAFLLQAAFNSAHDGVIRSFLKRAPDLSRAYGPLSCLETICHCTVRAEDDKKQDLFRLLLDHAGSSCLNDLNLGRSETGLIHEAASGNSVWVVEELIRRGADPNLRTGPAGFSQPALVYHICQGKLETGMALLHLGADPTEQDAMGVDCALAACMLGYRSLLDELSRADEEHLWGIDWGRTCDFRKGDGSLDVSTSGLSALHLSAFFGHMDCLSFYLDRQPPILEVDFPASDGHTPLFAAATVGRAREADLLCLKGAQIDFQHPATGQTALHAAVIAGNLETVQALLRHGAKCQPDFIGETPLIRAYQVGNQAIIEILQKAASPAETPLQALQKTASLKRQTLAGLAEALEHGVRSGNVDLCKEVHTRGQSLDSDLACGGCSPLILATQKGEFEIVRWLLEKGASTTKTSCKHQPHVNYETALGIAVRMATTNDADLISLFIERFMKDGGNIRSPDLVEIAATHGNVTALRILLQHPKNHASNHSSSSHLLVDGYFTTSRSPLEAAISAGHLESAKLLLQRQSAIDGTNVLGDLDQALRLAAQHPGPGQVEMVKLVLSHGADINGRDTDGKTAILLASKHGSQELLNCLLDAGAAWTSVDHLGYSVLHQAGLGLRTDTFANFVLKGASIHFKDWLGMEPLHFAMASDKLASFLLNSDCRMELASPSPYWLHGYRPSWIGRHFKLYQKRFGNAVLLRIADLEPPRRSTWSPLCLAAACGDTLVMKNLVELGASIDAEGSPHGSALMVACAYRKLESVRFLVRNRASLCYTSVPQSHPMSCFTAAQGSTAIMNWLLVGRYIEQHKISQSFNDLDGGDTILKPWSGISRAELVLDGVFERRPTESSREYFGRLQRLRRKMQGQRVPVEVAGRRTCRPSRLVPVETVRIHPDDRRVPR